MAYKYRLTGSQTLEWYTEDPKYSTSYGYIDYNIVPDFGEPLVPGEALTVEGQIYTTLGVLTNITIYFGYGIDFELFDADYELPSKKLIKFKKSVVIDGTYFDFPGRSCLDEEGPSVGADIVEGGWSGDKFQDFTEVNTTLQRALYLKYRLDPKTLAMDFERATPEGVWADDGQYLQCKTLKLAKNSQAVAGDFTKATIVCTGSDGSSRTVNLTEEQLTAAFSPDGYSETEPGIFADFVSALGVDYTLTLTLGDDYDQTTFTDAVMRSFARLHLSGAKGGGVAVGMFSTSTDDVPKFEVADTHETHLYGPLFCEGLPKGAMVPLSFFGVYVVANSIASSGHKSGSTTFGAVEGADGYAVMGVVGLSRYGVPSSASTEIAKISGRTLTAVLYNSTSKTTNVGALFIVMAYKKLNNITSTTSTPILPEGPEIFDDPYVDEGLARADYIAMMAGIEIPENTETTDGVQSAPNDIESPSIDGQPATSERFETVERYYKCDCWNVQMVRNAVGKWITADEAEEILSDKEGELHDSE